jgi:hypothetical protein
MSVQRLVIPLVLSVSLFAGSTPTSVTLTSSVNPSMFGHTVKLTAAISPAAATGKVSFYDGVSVLETEPISDGIAVFTTVLLDSGTRSIKAYYSGDAIYEASTSASLVQRVRTSPQDGFRPLKTYDTGAGSVAIGDFDGAGKPDLAVTSSIDSGTVSGVIVMLGNGDGTFQPPVFYPVGQQPANFAIGDFNGDGNADLAVADNINALSVLLGNGDGTFQPPLTTQVGASPSSVIVADFDADGNADLALCDSAGFDVALGNGDGTFQPALHYDAGDSLLFAIAAGDFNRDGKTDLVIAIVDPIFTVQLLLGNGDGTFAPPQSVFYTGGSTAASLAIADFNGDGNPDVAFTSASGLTVLLGNGDGTFETPGYSFALDTQATISLSAMAVGDFNGDGKADLTIVETLQGLGSLTVLLGRGDGTFQPSPSITTSATYSLAAGDFAANGRTDLAAAQGNLGVLLGLWPPCAAIGEDGMYGEAAEACSSNPGRILPVGRRPQLNGGPTEGH